ncbi:MAG: SPOR domain-containing protein [Clostridiales bacterium]|nr:SPOR domain-containing protein [Clostridiales bacterium]
MEATKEREALEGYEEAARETEPRYIPAPRRRGRRGKSHGALLVLLLGCAVLVLFIVSSDAAAWISVHIVAPVQGFFGIGAKADLPAEPVFSQNTPEPAGTAAPELVVTLAARMQYCLQMGYYNDAVSANIQASSLKAMGGAGYVYFDGQKYRVFAAAYGDLASADKVISQIQADGYEAATYLLQTNAAELTASGADTSLGDLADCGGLSERVLTLSYAFDKREKDQGAILSALAQLQTELTADYAAAARYAELQPLASYLSFCNTELASLTARGAGLGYTEFSAALKYLQLSFAVAYHGAIADIQP